MTDTNKILTIVLAAVICISALVIIYVNLPSDNQQENTNNNDNTELTEEEQEEEENGEEKNIPEEPVDNKIILNITYDSVTRSYTLSQIESMQSYTESGRMIKTGWLPEIKIEGPYNYTGVKISTLFEDFENLPDTYNISASSSDGWTTEFNYSQIQGNVDIYNATTGEIDGNGGVTMILAYKNEDEYLDESEGPLRIVFVDDGKITSSKLWPKMISDIQIT